MDKKEYVKRHFRLMKARKAAKADNSWGKPEYVCPECDAGWMQKNLLTFMCLAMNPPIYQYEYKCSNCGHVEYMNGK